jgi:hypothetical protein
MLLRISETAESLVRYPQNAKLSLKGRTWGMGVDYHGNDADGEDAGMTGIAGLRNGGGRVHDANVTHAGKGLTAESC